MENFKKALKDSTISDERVEELLCSLDPNDLASAIVLMNQYRRDLLRKIIDKLLSLR